MRARSCASICPPWAAQHPELAGENRMTRNHRIENSAEHQEVSALLPWYVNETLGERDRRARGRACRSCASCREDLDVQRRICAGNCRAEPALDYMPVASLKRLQARLDVSSRIGRRAAPRRAANVPHRMPWRGWMAASIAAAGGGGRAVGGRSLGAIRSASDAAEISHRHQLRRRGREAK